jgi:hypothetical protein
MMLTGMFSFAQHSASPLLVSSHRGAFPVSSLLLITSFMVRWNQPRVSVSKVDCSELPEWTAVSRLPTDLGHGRRFFAAELQRTAADLGKLQVFAAHFDEDCRGLWKDKPLYFKGNRCSRLWKLTAPQLSPDRSIVSPATRRRFDRDQRHRRSRGAQWALPHGECQMMIRPWRAGAVLAAFDALFHVTWSVLVASGLAQTVIDFIFWLHFIKPVYQIQPFDIRLAAGLVTVTATLGFVFGYVLALLWNWVQQSKERLAQDEVGRIRRLT